MKDMEILAPVAQNAGICVADLDGDGVQDLEVNGHLIRNLNLTFNDIKIFLILVISSRNLVGLKSPIFRVYSFFPRM